MIRIFLPRFLGIEKNHSADENTVGGHIARGTWTEPSSGIPSRSNSPGYHPQWVPAHPSGSPPPQFAPSSPFDRPPPSTTFQFILSCWLARFTTKFPLARRSSLYLPLPLFYPALARPARFSPFWPLSIFDPLSLYLHLFSSA